MLHPSSFFLGFSAALALVCASGCISREEVYQDIYRNRQAAYNAWKRAKEGEQGAPTVIRGKLDAASAVVLALGNNKQLKAILEDKDKAQGRITEAYAAAMPKLDLQASYKRLDQLSGSTTAGTFFAVGDKNNSVVNLVLSQPIFKGGAIVAGIRAARLAAYLTDEQVAGAVQDVVYKARLNYADVLLAGELAAVSEGDLKLAQAHLEDVEKKKAAGTASQYDVLRAKVEVTNVEADLIKRQNAYHLAVTTLLRTMGVSQESRVELTDKLEYVPIPPDIESAVKKAFLERPEILQAELTVRINRQALAEAWSGFLPRLDANFTHGWAKPDPHDANKNRWGQEWNAGVTLAWPLFDGLASLGRVQQARAGVRRAAVELADVEEQVLLDVKQALLNLGDAEKFVTSQYQNLERAQEGLRLAKAGYDAGVKTELEMLDARQALSQTQALYYQAVHGYETSKLALERASGALKNQNLGGLIK